HAAGGTGTKILSIGGAAYELWQSHLETIYAAATRNNFSDDTVGRGAPGALVATGLGTGYAVSGLPETSSESANERADRLVGEMLTKLKPGAVLQLWLKADVFDAMRNRQTPPEVAHGHSPIFREYFTAPDGSPAMYLIDQFAEKDNAGKTV